MTPIPKQVYIGGKWWDVEAFTQAVLPNQFRVIFGGGRIWTITPQEVEEILRDKPTATNGDAITAALLKFHQFDDWMRAGPDAERYGKLDMNERIDLFRVADGWEGER